MGKEKKIPVKKRKQSNQTRPMSKRVKKNAYLLQCLQNAPCTQSRNRIVEGLDKEGLDTICECALNVIKRNVPIKDVHKPALNAERYNIQALAQKKSSVKKKKKILQKGGFLPLLLSVVAPFVLQGLLSPPPQ